MSNELDTLSARIAERVGKDLVELIPDDQWQRLVNSEIDKFKLIVAPKIIQDLLKEAYLNKVKEVLDDLIHTSDWDEVMQQQIYSSLEKFIGQSSGVILSSMLSPSMQIVLQDLRNRLY